MKASDNIGELAAALAKVQGGLQPLAKNREVKVFSKKTNSSYTFSYTTFDAIIEAVRGPLADNGLAFAQGVGNDGVGSVLTTRLMHTSGQWIESDTPILVSDNGAQAFGSGITYAKRYALSSMLGIATDFDDDGNGSEGNSMESRERLQRKPDVTRDRHFGNSAEEILSGQNGIPGGKATAPAGNPKVWAASADAGDFLRDARADLSLVQNGDDFRRWMEANRWEHDAIIAHGGETKNKAGVSRTAFLNKLINETQERIGARAPNLRAAGD